MRADVPVAFIIFNRPDTTAMVFEEIRKAKPSKLYVIADGPRPDREGEKEKTEECRRYVEEHIDWPCTLEKIYSDVNLGCIQVSLRCLKKNHGLSYLKMMWYPRRVSLISALTCFICTAMTKKS